MPSQSGGHPPSPLVSAISDPPAARLDKAPEPVPADATPPPKAAARGSRRWRIYHIRRLSDRRGYVGVTRRSVRTRLAMHDHLARRRPRLGGPGTLAAAIRQAHAEGLPFQDAFQVEVRAVASAPSEARRLERDWIAALATARPHGFNIMPGGSSLGGPANAVPVIIEHPTRGILYYRSLMEAVADIDRERSNRGLPPLHLGSIYARRAMGWPIEEVLELTDHADGRRKRPVFRWRGRPYDSLHALAQAEGLPISTIRSRLYRAHQAGCDADHDAARDRRVPGGHRTGGLSCGRQPPLCLPHPLDREAGPVDAATFARLTGLPRATVLHRYHRLADRRGTTGWTRREVLAALTRQTDRRVPITLSLPNLQTVSGGVRAVIRAVLGNADLDGSRPERLGFSAIRARLRRVPGWPSNMAPQAIRWAFGFQPDAIPPVHIGMVAAE